MRFEPEPFSPKPLSGNGPDPGLRLPANGAEALRQRKLSAREHPHEVVLCYRENDQFALHVPRITERLKLAGYKVAQIRFDSSQDERDIATELLENPERLQGRIVLTDETVKRSLNDSAKDLGLLPGALDRCFNVGRAKALLEAKGKDHIHLQYDVTVDDARDLFVALVSEALRNTANLNQTPDRIVVFARLLHEHGPFCHEDVLHLSPKSMFELAHQNPAEYRNRSMYFGMLVKEWLDLAIKEAGLDPGIAPQIDLVYEPYDVLTLDIGRSERVWFIGDSHLDQTPVKDLKRADNLRDPYAESNPPRQSARIDREESRYDHGRTANQKGQDSRYLPGEKRRAEDRYLLEQKLDSERQLEAELRKISIRRGRAVRVRAALSVLGLDNSGELPDELKADQAAKRVHIRLPLPYLISFFEDHNLLTPSVSNKPHSKEEMIFSQIEACIAAEERRLEQAA